MRCLAAGVVLLAVAVAGCSGGEAAPAEVGPLASASPSASSQSGANSSVPPADATADTRSTPAAMPPDAVDATPQGASAFTRYYFDQVNLAYARRETSVLGHLSHPQCNSCASIIGDIERLTDAGLEVPGSRFRLDFVETAPAEDERVIVDYRFDADPYIERAANGGVTRSVPARKDVVGQARLIRDAQGWLMYGLRLVEE